MREGDKFEIGQPSLGHLVKRRVEHVTGRLLTRVLQETQVNHIFTKAITMMCI
jgi:hypothetical protein